MGESTLRDISQAVSNHIEPKLFPQIELVYIDNKPCIHVAFDGDEPPYFAYGRSYIRVADEDKQMAAAELEGFILRKNARTNTWDSSVSDKTSADVDDAVLKDYLERANQAGRIDFKYTAKEDVLRKLDLIVNGRLKNAASAIYVGWPLLEVQMAIFAGTERLTFIDIQRESGNVAFLVKTAERYIIKNIRWRVVFDGSLQRNEIPEIPMDAVREAIINSFCHRDYRSSQNNTISIYSNRVEIYNPGTFPDGLTPEDFIAGSELSVKRNPLLAQLMYYVKDIESFGTGLKRITDECDAAGVKVEFKKMKLGFAVVFYRPNDGSSIYIDADDGDRDGDRVGDKAGDKVGDRDGDKAGDRDGDGDKAGDKDGDKDGDRDGDKVGDKDNISDTQKQIMVIMSNDPRISAAAIAAEIGIAPRSVEKNIKKLKQAGMIDRDGPAFGGRWIVLRDSRNRG